MALTQLTAAAAILTLLLGGCVIDSTPLADTEDPDDATSSANAPATAEPTTTADPTDLPSSGPIVRRAVRRLLLARTGRVTATVHAGGASLFNESTFDIDRGFRFRHTLRSGDDLLRLDGILLGNDLWFQVLAPQASVCWVHTTPDMLSGLLTRPAAYVAPRPWLPGGLNVAATLRGSTGPDDLDYHRGSVRLVAVIDLLGPAIRQSSGIDQSSRVRVSATARILSGRLATIRIDGSSLGDALGDAEAEIPGIDPDTMNAIVSFSLPGTTVDLTPPPPERVVELKLSDGEEEFEDDMTACERRNG